MAVYRPESSGVDTSGGVDLPAVYVTLRDSSTNADLGTWLAAVRLTLESGGLDRCGRSCTPQPFERRKAAGHEAVCVSHQLPIWTLRRYAEHKRLWHDPRRRQCGLASLTSLEFEDSRIVGIRYREPAPLNVELLYTGVVQETGERATIVKVELRHGDDLCAECTGDVATRRP